MGELPLGAIQQQDWRVHFADADDVAVKMIGPLEEGTVIEQHQHDYDHNTFIVFGAAEVWKEGKCLGVVLGPSSFYVEARKTHMFVAKQNGTILQCIHNTHGKDGPVVRPAIPVLASLVKP